MFLKVICSHETTKKVPKQLCGLSLRLCLNASSSVLHGFIWGLMNAAPEWVELGTLESDLGSAPWCLLFLVSGCFYCSPSTRAFCFSEGFRLPQELLYAGLSLSDISVYLLSVVIHNLVVSTIQAAHHLWCRTKHKNLFEASVSSFVK